MIRKLIIPYGDYLNGDLAKHSVGKFDGLPVLDPNIKPTSYKIKVRYLDWDYNTVENKRVSNTSVSLLDAYNLGKLLRLTMDFVKVNKNNVYDRKNIYFSRDEILKGSKQSSYSTFANMAHWDLIRPLDKKTELKNSDGKWKITAKGITFCSNTFKIPKYYFTLSGSDRGVIAYQGPMIGLHDVKNFTQEEWQKVVGTI
jgi:hypothetical protein